MDILGILVILFLGAGIGRYLASDGIAVGLDALGAGFLAYREAGWPRGVQEGEPIPWKWAAMADRGAPPIEREPAPDAGAEIFEIDIATGAELMELESAHVGGGTLIRDRES
jgi:hypothetical protein